ncbi:RNA polymerase sigma factor RpoD [Alishewanella longhuensis]
METPIGDDEDSHLGDFIEDSGGESPLDSATMESLKNATNEVLAGLNGPRSQSTADAFWYRYEYRPYAGRSR